VLIDTALAADAMGQLATGNADVIKDLVQATVFTALDTATGFASKGEQDLTQKGIGSTAPNVQAASLVYGTATTLNGSETVDEVGKERGGDAWTDGGDAWKNISFN
jgi:hypothetical protein